MEPRAEHRENAEKDAVAPYVQAYTMGAGCRDFTYKTYDRRVAYACALSASFASQASSWPSSPTTPAARRRRLLDCRSCARLAAAAQATFDLHKEIAFCIPLAVGNAEMK